MSSAGIDRSPGGRERGELRGASKGEAMTFIQVTEFITSKFDEVMALDQHWRDTTEGKRTVQRSIVTQDRRNPNHYFFVAFFDSYEAAMENSRLPETQTFAEKYDKLVQGGIAIHDLDILADRS